MGYSFESKGICMNKVINKLFSSIVFRMGAMMFGVSFVAIVSMFSSVFISELADKDALAINHAGSLRMQSYKILADIQQASLERNINSQNQLTADIVEFEKKLNNPVLTQTTSSDEHPISLSLRKIQQHWTQGLALQIEQYHRNGSSSNWVALRTEFDNFVVSIDYLVNLYQQHAENRILLIRMIQGVSLFVTIVLVILLMLHLSYRVEKPLTELTNSARKIMAGDYTAHTNIMQNDELGFLSSTMNQMADAVSQSHLQLEKRVKQKTAELRQSNESLELLFEVSTTLVQSTKKLELEPIVKKLSMISGVKDLDLCLTTQDGSAPYEHIITNDREFRDNCKVGNCGDCLTSSVACETTQSLGPIGLRYPLRKGEFNFGVLVCNLEANSSLEAWQHQLFQSIAAQIATGLKIRQQTEQTRRLALVNERTVIARELHDSLAQALSYLKIQVTRLQKLHQKEASIEKIDEVVDELKRGLSSAYRQLRELLTTFRLKIDSDGLQQAFENTIAQLNNRAEGNIEFSLNYQIGDIPLTPNEEIHLMQIAREATQNALHHSQGSYAKVSLFSDQNKSINLVIEDDGVGLGDAPEKLNHYGLAIMKERASQLGANISIRPNSPTGTVINVTYAPAYVTGKAVATEPQYTKA